MTETKRKGGVAMTEEEEELQGVGVRVNSDGIVRGDRWKVKILRFHRKEMRSKTFRFIFTEELPTLLRYASGVFT